MRVGCEGAVTSSLHPSMRADSSDLWQAPTWLCLHDFSASSRARVAVPRDRVDAVQSARAWA
jgi:hypothetical protein